MRLKRRTKTYPWDPADGLDTDEERIAYLDAAFEEDDPLLVAAVLGDIARSKGMATVVADAGLAIERPDEPSSTNQAPDLGTVLDVVRALGLRLRAESATVVSPGDETEPQPGELRRSARPARILRRLAAARK